MRTEAEQRQVLPLAMKLVTAQDQAAVPRRAHLVRLFRPAVLFLFVLLLATPVPAWAQAVEPAPAEGVQSRTIQDLEALVATLEDDAERQQLIDRLKTLIEAQQPVDVSPSVAASVGARLLEDVSEGMGTVTREMVDLGRSAQDLPQLWNWLTARVLDPDQRAAALRGVVRVSALVVAALAVFFIVRRLLATPRKRLHGRKREPRWYERIVLTVGLLLIMAAPVAALLAVGYGIMPALDLEPESRVLALVILTGIATVQGIMIGADLLLQPSTPSLRWLAVSDETATYLQVWIRRLALVGVIGFFGAEAALTFGLPDGAYQLVTRLLGFVIALLVIIVIMQSRQSVAAWIRERRVVVSRAELAGIGEPETSPGDGGGDVPPVRPSRSEPETTASGMAADSATARHGEMAASAHEAAPGHQTPRKKGRSTEAIGRVLRDRLADVWHVLAALYVLAAYGVWALSIEGGFGYILRGTLLTVVTVLLASGVVTGADGGCGAAVKCQGRRAGALSGHRASDDALPPRVPHRHTVAGLRGRCRRHRPGLGD